MDAFTRIKITHWWPIVTFCPVNGKMDFIYIELMFSGFVELYEVRRKLRETFQGRTMFMEDVAMEALEMFPSARASRVRLMFNKHVVHVRRASVLLD
jgi:hypothetical protein